MFSRSHTGLTAYEISMIRGPFLKRKENRSRELNVSEIRQPFGPAAELPSYCHPD